MGCIGSGSGILAALTLLQHPGEKKLLLNVLLLRVGQLQNE